MKKGRGKDNKISEDINHHNDKLNVRGSWLENPGPMCSNGSCIQQRAAMAEPLFSVPTRDIYAHRQGHCQSSANWGVHSLRALWHDSVNILQVVLCLSVKTSAWFCCPGWAFWFHDCGKASVEIISGLLHEGILKCWLNWRCADGQFGCTFWTLDLQFDYWDSNISLSPAAWNIEMRTQKQMNRDEVIARGRSSEAGEKTYRSRLSYHVIRLWH